MLLKQSLVLCCAVVMAIASSESQTALLNQLTRTPAEATGESIDQSATDTRPTSNSSPNSAEDVVYADNATVGWGDGVFLFDSPCLQWTPLNHVYFQLANFFLLMSYVAFGGIKGLIYLRLMLALGSAFLAIWAWVIICAFDTFLWNALFTVINAVHGAYLLFTLRPVRFDDQVEEVYRTIFEPLKVSKQQFKKVVDCMKSIRPLKRGELFAVEKETKADTLSLLLSGRVAVMENGQTLQDIDALQFLDSPEWFGVGLSSDDYFQVSIRACEESRVMLWHRDKLKLILLTDPFLQAVFDHILGRDVVHKLVQMKDKITEPNQQLGNSITESWIGDEKSMLLSSPQKNMHQLGLVVDRTTEQSLRSIKETRMKGNNERTSSSRSSGDYIIVENLDSTDL